MQEIHQQEEGTRCAKARRQDKVNWWDGSGWGGEEQDLLERAVGDGEIQSKLHNQGCLWCCPISQGSQPVVWRRPHMFPLATYTSMISTSSPTTNLSGACQKSYYYFLITLFSHKSNLSVKPHTFYGNICICCFSAIYVDVFFNLTPTYGIVHHEIAYLSYYHLYFPL